MSATVPDSATRGPTSGRSAPARPTVVAAAGFVAIVGMAMWRAAPRVELDLASDVEAHALADLPEVRVRFDGRDATLSGTVADERERNAVIAAVARRWGVRRVAADGLDVAASGVVTAPRTANSSGGAPSVVRPGPSPVLAGAPATVIPTTVIPTTVLPTTISPPTAAPTTVALTTPVPVTIAAAVLDGLDRSLALELAAAPIRFAKSAAAADGASDASLDRVAAILLATPGPVVRIETHTDGSGSAEANLLLSEKRAQALRVALIGRGVPGERIQAEGFGESRPLVADTSDAARQRNRRVEIRTVR